MTLNATGYPAQVDWSLPRSGPRPGALQPGESLRVSHLGGLHELRALSRPSEHRLELLGAQLRRAQAPVSWLGSLEWTSDEAGTQVLHVLRCGSVWVCSDHRVLRELDVHGLARLLMSTGRGFDDVSAALAEVYLRAHPCDFDPVAYAFAESLLS